MPRRVLTADDRRRIQAFNDAMDKVMSEITEYDPERFNSVRQAVWDAHPLEDEVREAYTKEMLQNSADPLTQLEEQLKLSVFKSDAPWGLVVYRVAYGDDVAWERMLGLLRQGVESIQGQPANQHLFPRHRFEIVDDGGQLEGATMDQLHDKFSKWVVDEYRRNCKESERPSVEEFEADERGNKYGYWGGARYNFFLVVDEVCLESMDQECGPVVKIVQRTGFGGEGYSAEEIEELGPIQEDSNVGWMYMEVDNYVSLLETLSQPGNWEDGYLRPPQLRLQGGFEDAPGSWRRAGNLPASE
ncbi:hypothetical protein PT974_01976 [Cladobotryum mycophilum]|uniref:Uncharacterized protein n=1 Tax=Cladobotryum mycophilum TaxID=491253 RepID=A0ABR0SX24_9HYPO